MVKVRTSNQQHNSERTQQPVYLIYVLHLISIIVTSMHVLICLLKITTESGVIVNLLKIDLGKDPSLGEHQCVPRSHSQSPGYLFPVDNKLFLRNGSALNRQTIILK